ncbi:hypothetical protein [Parapedobacter sp. 2B3]|uniref:hypothetical protein n=1 Tax=Parapedobacter sp. 2B3 TaxID=3342381 RepID=UPI0035B6649C
MNKIASYPIFEADQVLTNNHLNDTVNYLDRQTRLSRVRLIGNGIVCGLEVTVTDESISVNDGHGITSQGYLIEHCQQVYTHYIDYASPEIPNSLNLIACCDSEPKALPYYGVEGILELLPSDTLETDKKLLSSLKTDEYVIVLLLEAEQVRLKNCDTNDCNDKGGRLDFVVKPLLVHTDLLDGDDESAFNTILLKRYGVPTSVLLENGEQILQAFYDIVDDDMLTKLGQNLSRCWDQYANILGLQESNPFKKLDLRTLRDKFSYQQGNFHYIQYFYDFIDDLIKAYREFIGKAKSYSGSCCVDEHAFPLHLALGLASESTRFGYWDDYRQYFIPVHYLYGQRHLKEEVAVLLQRLKYMVAEFDGSLPSKNQVLRIRPSNIGKEPLADRCIPFYYRHESLDKWWRFEQDRNEKDTAAPDKLLYDIESFNAFRIEGHVGKHYSTALSEIVAARDTYNLPFEVVALSAVDLEQIVNGNDVTCNILDLESSYNVLIAGLLCRVERILTYVGGLRPKRDAVIGDVLSPDSHKVDKATSILTLSKRVAAIKKEVSVQKGISVQPSNEKVNYISKVIDQGKDDNDVKLMDFVAKDINSFLIADRKLFEYVLPKPDMLLVFLQQLNAIFGYLFEHSLKEFEIDAYSTLWNKYEASVNSIIEASANSENEALKDYFAPKNNHVLFNCTNEELYAIKEEYTKRLDRYQEAVTFARYFETHRGLEHKAGVPKGGTFVLVYQPSSARYSPIIPERDLRLLAQPIETSRSATTAKPATTATKLLAADSKIYADAVSLIERLNLGTEASKVLDALRKRGEEEKQDSRLPGGVVIADFYVPYLCKSNCPPVAYVFPRPQDEPSEPGKPDEEMPAVAIEPTIFCISDKKKYAIKASPEGGKLTINGTESELTVVPAKFGEGIFSVKYTLPSGASAEAQFTVKEQVNATFGIDQASYSDRDKNWQLALKATLPDGAVSKSEWLLDGKPIAENTPDATLVLTPNNPKGTISYAIRESICGTAEQTLAFVRDEQARTIPVEEDPATIPVKTLDSIKLVSAPKGVTVKEGALVVSPTRMMKDGLRDGIIAYHYSDGEQIILAVLNLTLGTAAFEVAIGLPDNDLVLTRRSTTNTAVNIALNALSDGGTSTWTINGKAAKAKTSIPMKEFEQLTELVITHQIKFGDDTPTATKTFKQPLAAVKKQLEAGKGKIIVE